MSNRIKLMRDMIEKVGLEFVEYISNSKHNLIQARARAENGEVRIFGITAREGDPRGDMNELSRMKRFYRECTPQDTQLAQKLKEKLPELKFVKGVSEPIKSEALSSLPREPEPESAPVEPPMPNTPAPAPAPAPASAKPTKAKRKTPQTGAKKLTHAQFYKLTEWLKATDFEKYSSYWAIYGDAVKAIDVPAIQRSAMVEACELAGKKFPVPAQRAAAGVYASGVDKIVIEQLAAMLDALGMTPTEAFAKLTRSGE